MNRILLALILCLTATTAHAYEQACQKLSAYAREVAAGRYSGIDKQAQLNVVRSLRYDKQVSDELTTVVAGAYELSPARRTDFQYAYTRWYADEVYNNCIKKFKGR